MVWTRTTQLHGVILTTRSCCRDISYYAKPVHPVSPLSSLPFLALRAKMRRALQYQYAANRGTAIQTRLARSLVNPVTELKKSFASLRVHIVGNGRPSRRDRFR